MSRPGMGHDSYLLLAKESSYGTAPATAAAKYELASAPKLGPDLSTIPDPNINTSGPSPRVITPGLQSLTGLSFRIRVGMEGFEELFRFIASTYGNTNVEVGVEDHEFKEITQAPGHTLEFSMGNIPTGKVTRYTGCVCTGARANLTVQGETSVFIMDIEFSAEDMAINTTPMGGSPTVDNLIAAPFHFIDRTGAGGKLKDGSGLVETSIMIRGFSFEYTIPHETQRGFVGSKWADCPVRNGQASARLSFDYEWDSDNYILVDNLLNDTLAAGGLILMFQDPTTIGAASKRELEIKASSPVPAGVEKTIPGPGPLTFRTTFDLAHNASDASAFVIRNRSTTSPLT